MAETNKMQEDVRTFMHACGQMTPDTLQWLDHPGDNKLACLYLNLIQEEYKELVLGFGKGELVEVADGAGDLIWVILGMCNALGINIAPVWAEITASNMSKCVDGKVIRREDGKILKPESYFPPNIRKALNLEA